MGIDFAERPMLVFWETTRACPLACRHCRASATLEPAPGELTEREGLDLIDQVSAFGVPAPILVLTGGDCLMRRGLFDLVAHARSLGVPVALAPSVSPLLTPEVIDRIATSGVSAVSVSLDGADSATHDGVRGVDGHFNATVTAIEALANAGVTVQVNTTVTREGVERLADVFAIVASAGARFWELFFLVQVGRGTSTEAVTPAEHEHVCHFLYEASRYPVTIRTVEAPFFRRVVAERNAGAPGPADGLAVRLTGRVRGLLGPPPGQPITRTATTRDGKGILFVAHDGTVYPAGFLPVPLGNARGESIREIYRDHPLLRAVREGRFAGRCGRCEYVDTCGGSRSRAYASTGDPLGEDPACGYQS